MFRESLTVKSTTMGLVTRMKSANCQCIHNNTTAEKSRTSTATMSLEIVVETKASMVSTSVTSLEVTAPTRIISYSFSDTRFK